MKTLFFAIASLTLSLPASARQDQVANAIFSASQSTHGLTMMGKASATLRADSCYVSLYIGPNPSMGGGFVRVFPTTEERIQNETKARQEKRQALIDALRPLGLTLDKATSYLQYGPYGTTYQAPGESYLSVTLSISKKGTVIFGKSTLAEVRQTLKNLDVQASFIFSFSPTIQEPAQKTLPALAVKNGIEHAKSLAALGGASTIRLVRMEEIGGNPLQATIVTMPTAETLVAPENSLTYSMKLFFAPLDVVISTKK